MVKDRGHFTTSPIKMSEIISKKIETTCKYNINCVTLLPYDITTL